MTPPRLLPCVACRTALSPSSSVLYCPTCGCPKTVSVARHRAVAQRRALVLLVGLSGVLYLGYIFLWRDVIGPPAVVVVPVAVGVRTPDTTSDLATSLRASADSLVRYRSCLATQALERRTRTDSASLASALSHLTACDSLRRP